MTVQDKKIVSFHYTLTGTDGEELDSTRDREPMSYLHGAGNIIPGLETAMLGRSAGDSFKVTVAPEEAYGPRNEGNVQRIPIKRLGKIKPQPPDFAARLPSEEQSQISNSESQRYYV